MFDRWYAHTLAYAACPPYVHLVFGARQTGKSTLVTHLLQQSDVVQIDFTQAQERSCFLVDSDELIRLCRGLPKRRRPTTIFIDEAQLCTSPVLTDISRAPRSRNGRTGSRVATAIAVASWQRVPQFVSRSDPGSAADVRRIAGRRDGLQD